MSDITNFINEELYPRLFDRVGQAFPEMGFQQVRGNWISPLKLNGDRSHDGRKDKSVITARQPHRVLEQGGESMSLIDLYMQRHSLQFIEALRQLCSICGLELPQTEGAESYKAWKEKQDRLERVASQMSKALYTDEGAATLDYLKGRGCDEDFIKWGGFGFVSQAVLKELRDLFTYTNKDGQEVSLPYRVGSTYSLAIPYRTGGKINGFVFRSILTDDQLKGKPKYKDAFISATASKRDHLFGLTGLSLTGDRAKDRDITIVEGEIDALRATFCHIPNVVAASGGSVSVEALKEARRKGVKRVTLLFDTEATEQGREQTAKKVERAIDTINEAGLTPFVCYLPSPTGGGKEDTDSYLRTHTGEELASIIDKALSAPLWKFQRITEQAVATQGESGITFKNLDEYKRQTIALCNSDSTSATDRDTILAAFEQNTGGSITKEALQEEADALKLAAEKNLQRKQTEAVAAEALRLSHEGKTDEALSFLKSKFDDLQAVSKKAVYDQLLSLPTKEDVLRRFKERPVGIATEYEFTLPNKERQRLTLAAGGLTYICAPTSHGKSRFLENIALQVAASEGGGDVLYFSFEEDRAAVELQLLNIYANMGLSNNNLRTLNSHYTKGEDYFKYGVSMNDFKRKEDEFLRLLTTGRLRVFYEDYDSGDLIGAIRNYHRQRPAKAVFVDYIQLLHTAGTKLQRREELGEMCKQLWKLATELSIPIVLAAQLNRETYSPTDMTSQNIAEAADIERSANTIVLLWNSAFDATPQKSSYYTYRKKNGEAEKVLTGEGKKIADKGFNLGAAGQIYAKITKNRGGAPNGDAVLNFNGNTGRIEPNASGSDFDGIEPDDADKDDEEFAPY